MEKEDRIKWALLEIMNRAWMDSSEPKMTFETHYELALETFNSRGLEIIVVDEQ